MTLEALETRIEQFKHISANAESPEEVRRALYNVLTPPNEGSFPVGPHRFATIPAGTSVYRARWIEHREEIRHVADVWNPPSSRAGEGRLNRRNESLLYTALAPLVALVEGRVGVGDMFALSHFETAQEFDAVWVGEHHFLPELTVLQNKKKHVLDAFLLSVFSTPALSNPRPYMATEVLTKEFYDLPPQISRGWLYHSAVIPGGVNLAFRPDEGKGVLKFLGVHLAHLKGRGKDSFVMDQFDLLRSSPGGDELVSVATARR